MSLSGLLHTANKCHITTTNSHNCRTHMQDQRCIATSVQASDEYLATQRTPLQAQIRNNHGIDSRINNSKNMRTKLSRCISITPCIVWILSLLFFVHCSLCSSLPLSVTSSTAPGSELRPIGVLACRTAGLRKVGGGLVRKRAAELTSRAALNTVSPYQVISRSYPVALANFVRPC